MATQAKFSGNPTGADCSRNCLEAIELIYGLGLQPTPQTYETFYSYVAQTDLSIEPIIRNALREGRHLDESEAEALGAQVSGSSFPEAQLYDLTNRLKEGVSDTSVVIEEAVASTAIYCTSLDETRKGLSKVHEQEDLAAVVAGLVKTTEELKREGSLASRKLSEISLDVESVKGDLDKVRVQSFFDSLTGTANRRMFDRAFADALADAEMSGQALCLCMVDADHFKKFNDTHGHLAGDSALKLIADVLKNAVRDRDIVARYGGEEFALLLVGADLKTAVTVAERIRSGLATKKLIKRGTGENIGNVTVSIGVAQYMRGETISCLLERADQCLYTAKNNGRNKVVSEADIEVQPSFAVASQTGNG